MTKREIKRERRKFSRKYKVAYALHKAFREQYFASLLDLVQPVASANDQLAEAYDRRDRLERLLRSEKQMLVTRQLELINFELINVKSIVERVIGEITEAVDHAKNASEMLPLYPSVETIMKDLDAIEGDFVKWIYDGFRNVLTIRTDEITLTHPSEGFRVYFPGFDINLKLNNIAEHAEPVYSITAERAVYPDRAATREFIHPHVRNNSLCEGAGSEAAELFITRGLLQDFVVLINQILSTYNPDSPHLRLAYWTDDAWEEGMRDEDDGYDTCGRCGERRHRDDMSYCDDCDTFYCGGCSSWCDKGERLLCHECIDSRHNDHRGCCDHAGGEGCLLWENDACQSCDDVPSDEKKIECECDGSVIFCEACAGYVADHPDQWCEDCDDLGKSGCALLDFGLKSYDEAVPESCQDCDYVSYKGCLILLGEVDPPEDEDEQKPETEKEKEESTEHGTLEGRPEPAEEVV